MRLRVEPRWGGLEDRTQDSAAENKRGEGRHQKKEPGGNVKGEALAERSGREKRSNMMMSKVRPKSKGERIPMWLLSNSSGMVIITHLTKGALMTSSPAPSPS